MVKYRMSLGYMTKSFVESGKIFLSSVQGFIYFSHGLVIFLLSTLFIFLCLFFGVLVLPLSGICCSFLLLLLSTPTQGPVRSRCNLEDCSPSWSSGISVPRELVGNANLWNVLHTYWPRKSGGPAQKSALNKSSRQIWCTIKFENHSLEGKDTQTIPLSTQVGVGV